MNITDSTKQKLYARAAELFALAPWQWMFDTDIFAVQHPATNERGYCCVMGNGGELLALAVYKGDSGLASYDDILMEGMMGGGSLSAHDAMLIQDCLMVSFCSKEELPLELADELRKFRISVSAPNAYPVFEDFTPGLMPWHIATEAHAELLLYAIEQTLDIAPRYRDNEELLTPPAEMPDGVLLRSTDDNGATWADSWIEVSEYNIPPREVRVDTAGLKAALVSLEKRPKTAWLITFFSLPSPVQDDPAHRPYFPEMMIVVDLATGSIIGQEMYGFEQIESSLQATFAEIAQNVGFLPERVIVPYEEDGDMLAEICQVAEVEWEYNEETQELAEGIENMLLQHLGINPDDDSDIFEINEN